MDEEGGGVRPTGPGREGRILMTDTQKFTLNINTMCSVVLRERGVKAIREHYAELGLEPPEVEVGDTFTNPMWEIMNLMGSVCRMGPPPPFDTIIEVHEERKPESCRMSAELALYAWYFSQRRYKVTPQMPSNGRYWLIDLDSNPPVLTSPEGDDWLSVTAAITEARRLAGEDEEGGGNG